MLIVKHHSGIYHTRKSRLEALSKSLTILSSEGEQAALRHQAKETISVSSHDLI